MKIAIVGASGAVGQEFLRVLEERNFPMDELVLFGSKRSAGTQYLFRGQPLTVKLLQHNDDFKDIDIAFVSAGGGTSKEFAETITKYGAVMIDNSSAFRMDEEVPLVVPEVNPEDALDRPRGIIANPNCSTIQMVVALKPIHDAVGIERINVCTYQAVSGAGRSAIEELAQQTRDIFNTRAIQTRVFPKQIAFNVLPHIDTFQENGYTREEMKMVWETRKIFGDSSIQVNPTCVRVPVFFGHSEAVHIETREKIDATAARALLEQAEGVVVVDERRPGGYPTPVGHAAGKDPVFVGRIRDDISHPNGLDLWIVSDNIRKGAALNAVQVAELVAKNG